MTPTVLTLVLATTNAGKTAEFRALLEPHLDVTRVRLTTPTDLGVFMPPVEESGATFGENACLKALAYAAATGFPALADDSGLCVDTLGGAPGLYSARWAGTEASDEDRTVLLLRELRDVPPASRTARFVCAAAVAAPGGVTFMAEGVCQGRIAAAPRGENGFGYDPVFILSGQDDLTMAELQPTQKNLLSHRALALKALLPHIIAMGFPQR